MELYRYKDIVNRQILVLHVDKITQSLIPPPKVRPLRNSQTHYLKVVTNENGEAV